MEYYAVVSPEDIVLHVVQDTRDAGDPALQREMAALTHGDNHWVWVDGPVQVGDRLAINEDGCAEVVPS